MSELMPAQTDKKYQIKYIHDTIVIGDDNRCDTFCLSKDGYVGKTDRLLFFSTKKDTVFRYSILSHEYRTVIHKMSLDRTIIGRMAPDTAMYCTSFYKVNKNMADDDYELLSAFYYDEHYVIKKIVRPMLVSFE